MILKRRQRGEGTPRVNASHHGKMFTRVTTAASFVKLAVFLVAAGTASALFINACDVVYHCGCRSWWNGAAEACNIHVPESRHCPWCLEGGLGGYISFAAVILCQATISFWPSKVAVGARLTGTLLAFPVVAGLSGLLFGLLTGYWSS